MSLIDDINNFDPENLGSLGVAAKALLIFLVCALVIGAGIYFDTLDQQTQLEQVQLKEIALRKEFEKKQAKAVNLDGLKEQLAEMNVAFESMKNQLPNKTEVAGLLEDVSQTGLVSGLKFELFQPQGELPKEFYAELPIKIRVIGSYHEFGNFVSGIAALPRIVTINNLSISRQDKKVKKGAPALIMEATATTYRYLDEGEGGTE